MEKTVKTVKKGNLLISALGVSIVMGFIFGWLYDLLSVDSICKRTSKTKY